MIIFCRINFHIISYVKKFLIALVLVFLSGKPLEQTILILAISLTSVAITIITHPFRYCSLNCLRIAIELLTAMLAVMHVVFYVQVQKFEQEQSTDERIA